MTIDEINKLKVGDKIFINAFDRIKGRVKKIRVIKQILDHNNPTTHGYPHLAVNRIIVDCFNELYELSSWDIYKTEAEYKKIIRAEKKAKFGYYGQSEEVERGIPI